MVPTQYKKTLGAILNCEIGWNIHEDQDENCPLDKKQAYWCPPRGYSFSWPIQEGSAQKWYLFQASG